jgi:hypothetical protein
VIGKIEYADRIGRTVEQEEQERQTGQTDRTGRTVHAEQNR